MKQIARLTKKNGEVLKGYWNGKIYSGGRVCFNVSADGTHAGINWKKAIQLDRVADIKSIKWEDEKSDNDLPKTVEGWMKEMERAEARG